MVGMPSFSILAVFYLFIIVRCQFQSPNNYITGGGGPSPYGLSDGCSARPEFPIELKNKCTNILRCKCYQTCEGCMCCNKELENLMRSMANDPCYQRRWRGANNQRMANDMQNAAQQHFGRSFESIAGCEFAARHSFRGDLMCRIKTPDGKSSLLYASPVQYSITPDCPSVPIPLDQVQSKCYREDDNTVTDV